MLRGLIKTGTALTLERSGVARLAQKLTGSARMPLIVGYHRVVESMEAFAGWSIPAMLITPKMLERQLDWIGRRYQFATLDEVAGVFDNGRPLGRPLAAVTFDDGYRDFHDLAFPLLWKKGIPSAVFVVTEFLGGSGVLIHDRLYLALSRAFRARNVGAAAVARLLADFDPPLRRVRITADAFQLTQAHLARLSYARLNEAAMVLENAVSRDEDPKNRFALLSREMVEQLHHKGVTIGSHSSTHAVLTNETSETALEQAVSSRRALERMLGAPVRHFAYPCGRFDSGAIEAVAAAGYSFAYTVCNHRASMRPLLTIPRRMFWENSGVNFTGSFSSAIMNCNVSGIFDLAAGCRQNHDGARARALSAQTAA